MKFTCPTREFRQSLSVTGRFVPVKSHSAIYTNTKLVAHGSGVTVMGRNPEASSGIRYEVSGAVVQSPGTVLLPKRTLDAIMGSADEEDLSFSLADKRLDIRGSHAKWSVSLDASPDLFSDPPEFDESTFAVLASDLSRLIARTGFACNPDVPQYCLGGILIDSAAARLTFVATDAKMICRASCPSEGDPTPPGVQWLLPKAAADDLAFAMGSGDDIVEVGFPNGTLVATRPGVTVAFNLMQGVFPDYTRGVLAEDGGHADMVNAKGFLRAIDQASAVTGPSSNLIRFDFGPERAKLSAVASQVGSSTVNFPLEWAGPPASIGFAPTQVRDILRAIGDNPARLLVTGAGRQLTIKAVDYDGWIIGAELPENQG